MDSSPFKEGMLVKRSQQRKSVGPVNYKHRVFVLNDERLSYYEGESGNKGKLKGSIFLGDIRFIGPLDYNSLNRMFAFQISHGDSALCCVASTDAERDEWIKQIRENCTAYRNLTNDYHSGIYSSRVWICCGKTNKFAKGCKEIKPIGPPTPPPTSTIPVEQPGESDYTDPSSLDGLDQPLSQGNFAANYRTVVALYDFKVQEEGDLTLCKDKVYYIVEESSTHWWRATDGRGNYGVIPSNFIK